MTKGAATLFEAAGLADIAPRPLADILRPQTLDEVIGQDRPVRAWFPSQQELTGLAFRRQPKVQQQIRAVQVEGFDLVPCGGTHCQSTGQVEHKKFPPSQPILDIVPKEPQEKHVAQ